MSITVESVTKEDTAYDKYIQFTYKGESYSVLLHWDKHEGYEITFTELDKIYQWIDDPEWATNWDDNNDTVLAFVLDDLTDETLEEVA